MSLGKIDGNQRLDERHHASETVSIRRLTLGKFILWCHERTVTQAREVTERYQRHLFYYRKRTLAKLGLTHR